MIQVSSAKPKSLKTKRLVKKNKNSKLRAIPEEVDHVNNEESSSENELSDQEELYTENQNRSVKIRPDDKEIGFDTENPERFIDEQISSQSSDDSREFDGNDQQIVQF